VSPLPGQPALTVGSLFSGIGGLDLGLERAGMRVVWQSENDPYACQVLAKHWPAVPNLGDITQIDWSTVEPVDVICGGYPCQPFSLAGVRRGEDDARHLWPHFADAIRLLRPRWALLENVPGHLSLGFGRVLGDLAELGFDADWDCIPAAAVGAPHLRYRVIVIAHANQQQHQGGTSAERRSAPADLSAHTNGQGQSGHAVDAEPRPRIVVPNAERPRSQGQPRTSVGLSLVAEDSQEPGRQWLVEPDVGRVAHGIPSRVDRLRCLGNAVVPQVAEYVGRRIVEAAA
jgi:DNA (cytosine-5)-methyltransferase 1